MKKNRFKHEYPLPMSVKIIFVVSIITNITVTAYIVKTFLWV